MNGRVLLDANFIVAIFRQDPVAHAALLAAGRIFVPSIVLGELYFGAEKSGRQAENIARIDRFAAVNEVLLPDVESARTMARSGMNCVGRDARYRTMTSGLPPSRDSTI